MQSPETALMEALFESCESITAKAFQYRPLTSLKVTYDDGVGTNTTRVAIPLRSTDSTAKQSPAKHPIVLQQKLFDESVRLAQEQLLLHRMYMSHAVAATSESDTQDPDRAVLRKHVAAARMRQVETALQLHNELDSLLQQIRQLQLQCLQQHDANRKLYAELVRNPKRQDDEDSSSKVESENAEMEDKKSNKQENINELKSPEVRLEAENTMLKCVIADLIAGSGLDWYSDCRLRRMLEAHKSV